jgi:UDP-3-O-[3-hydroxymyristoyl] glucosamine N-acyltransferase
LSELAALVGGEVVGNPSSLITGVNGLAEAGPTEISFYANSRYRNRLATTRAAAVLVDAEPSAKHRDGISWVRVKNPHLAFAKVARLFAPPRSLAPGVRPGAHVHPQARVHPEATVMSGCTVERGATLGPRSLLFPGVFVGEEAKIGEDCILYPNVTIREGCVIGSRVILHASCVIGDDGFGFAFDPEVPEHYKVPQLGIVRIEDDVEVGACACIDRATVGETVIGRGTKIDNLVQVAHNVKIGPLTLICGQAGVSGSVEIGTGVVLAGQVGIVGHIRVGNLAKVGAQAGVAHDVEDGATLSGSPAIDHRSWLKNSAAFAQLASLMKEVRQLRKEIEQLRRQQG